MIIKAREKPPTFLAIQATLENFADIESCFRQGEVTVRSNQKFIRIYRILLPRDAPEGIDIPPVEVAVPEGDYFVWQRDVDPRSSLMAVQRNEFNDRYELDPT